MYMVTWSALVNSKEQISSVIPGLHTTNYLLKSAAAVRYLQSSTRFSYAPVPCTGFFMISGFNIFSFTSFCRASLTMSCNWGCCIHNFCGGSKPTLSVRQVISAGSCEDMDCRSSHLVHPCRILNCGGSLKMNSTSL